MGYAKRPQAIYEQKAVVVGEIIRDQIREIQIIRDVLSEAEGLENITFLESGNAGNLSFRNGPITLHVLIDVETTFQIILELNARLTASSRILGCKAYANVMSLTQLLNEIARLGVLHGFDHADYRRAGLNGVKELKQLIRRCDGCLVNELNKKRTRFTKRTGVIWKTTLYLERRQYNRCLKRFELLFNEYIGDSMQGSASCSDVKK